MHPQNPDSDKRKRVRFWRILKCQLFLQLTEYKYVFIYDDHNPPHFHALFAEYEVVIKIKTLEILEGSLPKRKMKKALEFANKNQDLLMEIWDKMQGN